MNGIRGLSLLFGLLAMTDCGARQRTGSGGEEPSAIRAEGPATAAPAQPGAGPIAAEYEAIKGDLPANRLALESSPYLLLHAHNPVDWYPWAEEALAKARHEQKPIFLSVGYSTCYWCHVMEREVFSDPAIARLMNEGFVSIKVDREERPDIDEIYMTATQLLTRGGGWPNSVFLTPDLKPFFAGTYFPPEDRFGRPGFPTVLARLREAWTSRRREVETSAEQMASAIRQVIAERREPAASPPSREAARRAISGLQERFDQRYGGFGGPPKFPSPANLFLLWEAGGKGDARAREMVVATLRGMGRGAIYDQLDGGFHRYTLDIAWRIPHFEKMLYDNAHLAELASLAWEATKDPEIDRLARGTLDFVLAQMTRPEGAFVSAIDAEIDGEEGAYYTWTKEELERLLGSSGYAAAAAALGFDGPAELEGGRHTVFLAKPGGDGAETVRSLANLEPQLAKLRAARRKRKFPLVDDKVLTDWNGMMVAAFARAARSFREVRYAKAAERAAEFLLANVEPKTGTLRHAWRNGEGKIPAFLDDYAFLVRGLLALHKIKGEPRWLAEAERLTAEMEARLRDPRGGYFAGEQAPDLLFQAKTVTDGAIPSGNGVAIVNLLALAERTGKATYREAAQQALRAFAWDLESYPLATPTLALAVLHQKVAQAAQPVGTGVTPQGVAAIAALAREVVSAQARRAGRATKGWIPFEVTLAIRGGWHVNANPASLDFLVPTKLEGELRNLSYPRGRKLKLGFSPEILSVWSGEVRLTGETKERAKSLRLTYQACDDTRCLPPVTRELALSD